MNLEQEIDEAVKHALFLQDPVGHRLRWRDSDSCIHWRWFGSPGVAWYHPAVHEVIRKAPLSLCATSPSEYVRKYKELLETYHRTLMKCWDADKRGL